MTPERWNTFIAFVNNNRPKSELNPPIRNEEENRIFDNMVAELKEMRKERPEAAFFPVESEW